MPGRDVGHVAGLWRYPVKSMGAESLDAVDVSWHGLAGDRRWGFVRGGMVRSGFPWLTIRERPDMGHYQPSFAEPDRPDASLTRVRTPAGRELDVVDPALAAELGPGVRVIKQDRAGLPRGVRVGRRARARRRRRSGHRRRVTGAVRRHSATPPVHRRHR